MDVHQHSNSQVPDKTFSLPNVSDSMYAEASAGQHQRLIRTHDGRRELVIRDGPGVYRHVAVIEFDHAGVQA